MKIVNVEDFFHPDAGYQINILSKYLSSFGHEVVIVTTKMDKIPSQLMKFFSSDDIEKKDEAFAEKNNIKIVRLPIKKIISGRAILGKCLHDCIKKECPDILYLHGNDTLSGMQYISKSGKLSFPIITDSHMLEMASENKFNKLFRKFYKLLITPKIIKNKIPVIRTQDDDYVERCLGIPLSQAPWISVGSDTLLFHPNKDVRILFREKYNISEDDFVVVYTGKLDKGKGGKLLAETFVRRFDTNKNVVLLVVGTCYGTYGEEVDRLFLQSENRIIRFPTQLYIELAQFYQAADLSVFAKQCSLSFYDAQACGLPVVSEDNNINVDRNSHGNGRCFKAGDSNDFRVKITEYLNMQSNEFEAERKCCHQFIIDNYDYKDIAQQYIEILEKEYRRFSNRKGHND